MCYSVTLYLPGDVDQSVIAEIFERHHLRFVANHVPLQATPGKTEIELLMLYQGCDCSFVGDAILDFKSTAEESERKKMELRQKNNWSTAKLTRAQADQEKARESHGKDLTPEELIVLITEVLEQTHSFGIYYIWCGIMIKNRPFSKERIHLAELSPERMAAFEPGIRYQIIK
ncbi:MAG TPA: hypothetical protein VGL77_00375 [Armatimonadota bacterium]|jgi:hypothetical protein